MSTREVLIERWAITERRGGSVFKTRLIEEAWVPWEDWRESGDPDIQHVPLSTKRLRAIHSAGGSEYRRV